MKNPRVWGFFTFIYVLYPILYLLGLWYSSIQSWSVSSVQFEGRALSPSDKSLIIAVFIVVELHHPLLAFILRSEMIPDPSFEDMTCVLHYNPVKGRETGPNGVGITFRDENLVPDLRVRRAALSNPFP